MNSRKAESKEKGGYLHNFAGLLSLVVTTDNLDFVVLADRDALNVVLLPQILAQWGTHDLTPDVARRVEVRLAVLAA
jgi:hypothetical protein